MHRFLSATTVSSAQDIRDLRDALAFLSTLPGHLSTTSKAVDAHAELAGIYKRIGAGTPVAPPTRIGPAMLFENVKGYPDVRVLVGMLASRERTALLLGSTVEQLPFTLLRALDRRIAPMTVSFPEGAPCQEVVHRAPLDIRSLLPAPTNTLFDAGPYFNLGLLRAEDPETGEADVTIHRLCVQGSDRLTVYFVPGRHIDQFRIKAEQQGKPLPVSINMGLDPAIYLAACFEPPTTPLGFDELTIAGGLRQRPVELVDCVSVPAKAIARAEIVIEGEILPGERMREDINTGTGFAMPEFPGYLGQAQSELPVIRVTAVTHRFNPILQTIVGPGEEHVNLAGIPTEASILRLVENRRPPGWRFCATCRLVVWKRRHYWLLVTAPWVSGRHWRKPIPKPVSSAAGCIRPPISSTNCPNPSKARRRRHCRKSGWPRVGKPRRKLWRPLCATTRRSIPRP